MTTLMSLEDVSAALESADAVEVMTASWEAFNMGERIADAAAFEEGFDELQAAVAAQVCVRGQTLLPLPADGAPVPLPGPPTASADACAVLLRTVHRSLSALARTPEVPDEARDSLARAASLAEDGAACLSALRTA
ncbi:hypothetical protein [Streptomyces marincola]|uniref:hypothetical protein n=1 Tax=Streptomyces marincola TaxID=2878388 RepID=UPI001CF18731|nr:hypothetical protein [Streptomyces marincola]UCM88020.1 hypothetical protein LC193_08660 [Streptomyces marincola]